ncbi:aldehyde ferredoxin oxidoreductase C-terminal domain-containing protein, partial [Chloroflexota bacterium]
GGLKLGWGSTDAIQRLMEMIASREGIGDILAEGTQRASEVIGKGSDKYVMAVKGMSLDTRDPRGSKGFALGYAVSSRGAEHCRYSVPDFSTGRYLEPVWLKEEVKGFRGFDRLVEEGKGAVHKWYEDMRAFEHSLEMCYFVFSHSREPFTVLLAKLYNGITGLDIDAGEVKTIGERIVNLERAFNVREGLTRKDDCLPERFLKEPMPAGPTGGQVVNLDLMLDEYYEQRGWDKATGFPKREKLEQLGLKEVAEELTGMGRLA